MAVIPGDRTRARAELVEQSANQRVADEMRWRAFLAADLGSDRVAAYEAPAVVSGRPVAPVPDFARYAGQEL